MAPAQGWHAQIEKCKQFFGILPGAMLYPHSHLRFQSPSQFAVPSASTWPTQKTFWKRIVNLKIARPRKKKPKSRVGTGDFWKCAFLKKGKTLKIIRARLNVTKLKSSRRGQFYCVFTLFLTNSSKSVRPSVAWVAVVNYLRILGKSLRVG